MMEATLQTPSPELVQTVLETPPIQLAMAAVFVLAFVALMIVVVVWRLLNQQGKLLANIESANENNAEQIKNHGILIQSMTSTNEKLAIMTDRLQHTNTALDEHTLVLHRQKTELERGNLLTAELVETNRLRIEQNDQAHQQIAGTRLDIAKLAEDIVQGRTVIVEGVAKAMDERLENQYKRIEALIAEATARLATKDDMAAVERKLNEALALLHAINAPKDEPPPVEGGAP